MENVDVPMLKQTQSEENKSLSVQKVSPLRGWPFFAIGAIIILFAGISFVMGVIGPVLPLAEGTDAILTIGPLGILSILFPILVKYLLVAILYILYGIHLRKNPSGERLPAYLEYVRRQSAKAINRNKSFYAWVTRGTSIVAMVVLIAFFLTSISGYRNLTLQEGFNLVGNSVFALALCGLGWIQAEAVHPLRPTKDNQ